MRAQLGLGFVGALLLLASSSAVPSLASPIAEERVGIVDILPDGSVLYQGKKARAEELGGLLQSASSAPARVRLELRPNPGASYEDLIAVMNSAKDAGFYKVALVVTPETERLVPTPGRLDAPD